MMRMVRIAGLWAATAMVLGTSVAKAGGFYDVTYLGTGTFTDLNNRGQIVGFDFYGAGNTPFILDGGVRTYLPTSGGADSRAYAINDSGDVVGYTSTPSRRFDAFLYSGGSLTLLPTLGGFGTSSAYGVNASRQVVGFSPNSAGVANPFLYDRGTMTDLGNFGFRGISSGQAINASGQVVGYAAIEISPGSSTDRAFLYEGGVMKDLGTLGGFQSAAYAINDAGQVVGYSATSDGAARAFLYEGGVMKDLGSLAPGRSSMALDVNASGRIVGYGSDAPGSNHGFLYEHGRMIDLNTRIDPSLGLTIIEAKAINDAGAILATARNASYQTFGVLLTPTAVPEPGGLLMLAIGGGALALAARRRA